MNKKVDDNNRKFNIFNFLSTFSKCLIEIFISLYLFKNGFDIKHILLFYILENFFAIFISYFYVKIGEKYSYSVPISIGIVSFIGLQVLLNKYICNTFSYLLLISIVYSMYRRGYWVSRRFYITTIMPKRASSERFSIVTIVAQLASILSGYIGSYLLDSLNMGLLTMISAIVLLISIIPLIDIDYDNTNTKIELIKNLKKYDIRNFLAFSIFELDNLLEFIFPIYIAIYIKNSYMMAGTINAVSNISIIIFIFIYGKIIKKKNYFIISTILFILLSFSKLFITSYLILFIYFFDGIVKKMQNQSLNKIYFENHKEIDNANYNLIYQILESVIRLIVAAPLLLFNDIKYMIIFVLIVILIELIIYIRMKKNKVLN